RCKPQPRRPPGLRTGLPPRPSSADVTAQFQSALSCRTKGRTARRPPAGRRQRLSSTEEDVRTRVRKAEVMGGLILLVLIGILMGFVVARVRKRMGFGVTWSPWVTTVVVVGFILLLLYATSVSH